MPGLTISRRPELRDPAMVVAFAGWNDAGEAASAAVRWLVRRLPGQRFASIDPELYHEFTSTRPTVRHVEGERRISWPAHDFFSAAADARPRDLIVLVAREPELHWRNYCETVLDLARQFDVRTLISLGAFLGDTPHVRPVPVSGFATTEALRDRLPEIGADFSNYEGSTGITGVLHDFCRQYEIPSVSLWAAVPHYLPTIANPKAALALVQRVDKLLSFNLDLSRLEQAAAFFQRQVDEAVSRDRRATGYLRELERRAELPEPSGEESEPREPLPSADDIIRDLEDFLRSRGSDND